MSDLRRRPVEGRVIFGLNRNVFNTPLYWDITRGLEATLGFSCRQNDADGVLWAFCL